MYAFNKTTRSNFTLFCHCNKKLLCRDFMPQHFSETNFQAMFSILFGVGWKEKLFMHTHLQANNEYKPVAHWIQIGSALLFIVHKVPFLNKLDRVRVLDQILVFSACSSRAERNVVSTSSHSEFRAIFAVLPNFDTFAVIPPSLQKKYGRDGDFLK